MQITIDTEKDFDQIIKMALSLPDKEKSLLIKRLQEISRNQFSKAHHSISQKFKERAVSKDEILSELKKMRKESESRD